MFYVPTYNHSCQIRLPATKSLKILLAFNDFGSLFVDIILFAYKYSSPFTISTIIFEQLKIYEMMSMNILKNIYNTITYELCE